MPRPETSQHREAYEAWYASRRDFAKTSQNLTTNKFTLYNWADRYHWYDRADARDQAAQRIADTEAAKETAKFLKAQQQAGQLLRLKGLKHLSENDIDDGRTAITAIKTGIDIERQALGLPEWIAKILNADADTLDAEIAAEESRKLDAGRRQAIGNPEEAAGASAAE